MKIACPVPMSHCSGGKYVADDVRDKFAKCHMDYSEVLKCQGRYLISLGYKRRASREFLSPDGTILILSRKPGLLAKPGKRVAGEGGVGSRIEARGIRAW